MTTTKFFFLKWRIDPFFFKACALKVLVTRFPWIAILCTYSLLPESTDLGTFLMVQWLGFHTSTAGGAGSIPGPGTKISHAKWQGLPYPAEKDVYQLGPSRSSRVATKKMGAAAFCRVGVNLPTMHLETQELFSLSSPNPLPNLKMMTPNITEWPTYLPETAVLQNHKNVG